LLDLSVEPAEDEERGSPIEITRQRALSDLAESFFEDEKPSPPGAPRRLSKAEIDALLSRAIDYQTRGKIDEAIEAYEEVIDGGGEQPAVNFNLGSHHFADARALIDAGVALALATDINPGSAPCPSLPLTMAIACRYQHLLPN
jgi:tetratricopeptide (TPR) repeat protein